MKKKICRREGFNIAHSPLEFYANISRNNSVFIFAHHEKPIARLSTEYMLKHPDLYSLLRTNSFPRISVGKEAYK